MMLGMRENIDDISYDKITSVKLEKGVFSATILIRARGPSEMSRLGKPSGLLAWGREGDGQIDAIPKDKAEQLLIIIKQRMSEPSCAANLDHRKSAGFCGRRASQDSQARRAGDSLRGRIPADEAGIIEKALAGQRQKVVVVGSLPLAFMLIERTGKLCSIRKDGHDRCTTSIVIAGSFLISLVKAC
jgi:hypothetical protein